MTTKNIYIDPSYPAFYRDKLFDLSNPVLNRDDQLLAMVRMRDRAEEEGYRVVTADRLFDKETYQIDGSYYSMGISQNYDVLKAMGVDLQVYMFLEPPVVAPHLYDELPLITTYFTEVYVHNTHGNGYSLKGLRVDRLRKFYWPIPYRGVIASYWNSRNRKNRVVVINGHHRPISKHGELYSKRIEAIAALVKHDVVDLYGVGWDKWLTRCSFWMPYLLHRSALMKAYQGVCVSKYETLSRYTYCLCFENMCMDGYITEKIFDCLYAGTIPLYLGAKDITDYIPKETFVDCRKLGGWDNIFDYISSMTVAQVDTMREAGRVFMESEKVLPYYNSLEDIVLGKRL